MADNFKFIQKKNEKKRKLQEGKVKQKYDK